MYNNTMLILEKYKVREFLEHRAIEKSYPIEYMVELMPLFHNIYEVCKLPQYDSNLPIEVSQAFDFAKEQHKDQLRRFISLPYIVHPLEMATRLALEGFSYEALMGALLHDVVEDCGISLDEIKNKFGKTVQYYVYHLSDIAPLESGNRATRLEINFNHFQKSDWVTHNIKLTDLISNTRSLVLCDPRFAQSYVVELVKGMHYFRNNKDNLNSNLYNMLEQLSLLSEQVIELQNKYKIPKLESKKNK